VRCLMHTEADLRNISNKFKQVRFTNDKKFTCCCPVHQDKRASAFVQLTDKGYINLHCSAGCTKEELRSYMSDLGLNKRTASPSKKQKPKRIRDNDGYMLLLPVPIKHIEYWTSHMTKLAQQKDTTIYPYISLDNKKQLIVTRVLDSKGNKLYLPHTFWINKEGNKVKVQTSAPMQTKPLYFRKETDDLEEITVAHIYEGEKTTNAGANFWKQSGNIIHISWMNGAKTWDKAEWKELLKLKNLKDIYLFPDNDKAGMEAMRGIGVMLHVQYNFNNLRMLDFKVGYSRYRSRSDVRPGGTLPGSCINRFT